jgi:hypothetical protein
VAQACCPPAQRQGARGADRRLLVVKVPAVGGRGARAWPEARSRAATAGPQAALQTDGGVGQRQNQGKHAGRACPTLA